MKSTSFVIGCLILAAMDSPHRAKGQVSFLPTPGVNLGESRCYWLGPYVKATVEKIGGHTTQTVTWFSEDGSVKRQIASRQDILHASPGYVVEIPENGNKVAYGVNEPWDCALPKKPGFTGPDTATPDSRTFVAPFDPEEGLIAADVYVHGVLANTLGPFVQYKHTRVTTNEDGSMAILIWKDATKTTPQIVCTDHDGKIQFRVDCEDFHGSPIPASGGLGVLLNQTCYTRDGKGHSVREGGVCVGWIPGTLKSLFTAGVSGVKGFKLIDWDLGRVIWEIPLPGGGEALAMIITPRLVIFAVAEWYQPGPWKGFQLGIADGKKDIIRAFYAVRTEDGRLVSRWQPEMAWRYPGWDSERFMQVGKKLYFVDSDQFTELSEDDILFGRKGWKAVTGDK